MRAIYNTNSAIIQYESSSWNCETPPLRQDLLERRMSFISGEAGSVLVSMLHMSKATISCIGAVCMCMVFGIGSHARIDAISILPEDGGKADPESVPDVLCPPWSSRDLRRRDYSLARCQDTEDGSQYLLGQTAHGASVMPAAHNLGLAQACTAVLEL